METELEELTLASSYDRALALCEGPDGPERLDKACLGLLDLLSAQLGDGGLVRTDPDAADDAHRLLAAVIRSAKPRETILGLLNALERTSEAGFLMTLLPLTAMTLQRLPSLQPNLNSVLRLIASFLTRRIEDNTDEDNPSLLNRLTPSLLAFTREFPSEPRPASSLLLVLFRILELEGCGEEAAEVARELSLLRPDAVWEMCQEASTSTPPRPETIGLLAARLCSQPELVSPCSVSVRSHSAVLQALLPHVAALLMQPGRDVCLMAGVRLLGHHLHLLASEAPWKAETAECVGEVSAGLAVAMVTCSVDKGRAEAVRVMRMLMARFDPEGTLNVLRCLNQRLPLLDFFQPIHISGVRGQLADAVKADIQRLQPVFRQLWDTLSIGLVPEGALDEQTEQAGSLLSLAYLALRRFKEDWMREKAADLAERLETRLREMLKETEVSMSLNKRAHWTSRVSRPGPFSTWGTSLYAG